jgi:hypothetical protein
MWNVVIGAACLVIPTALVLWMVWPARTGAVAAGERGNDGLIPSSGEPDSGPVAPGEY